MYSLPLESCMESCTSDQFIASPSSRLCSLIYPWTHNLNFSLLYLTFIPLTHHHQLDRIWTSHLLLISSPTPYTSQKQRHFLFLHDCFSDSRTVPGIAKVLVMAGCTLLLSYGFNSPFKVDVKTARDQCCHYTTAHDMTGWACFAAGPTSFLRMQEGWPPATWWLENVCVRASESGVTFCDYRLPVLVKFRARANIEQKKDSGLGIINPKKGYPWPLTR